MQKASYLGTCLVAAACMCALHGQGKIPIVSEATIRQVLATVFPHMVILRDGNKRIDTSHAKNSGPSNIRFPDAFAGQQVYRVEGSPQNVAEEIASEDMVSESHSSTRQVRLKVFSWPRLEGAKLLAVLQYDFVGAKPAFSGPTIGMLVELKRQGKDWSLGAEYLLEPRHHFSIQRADLEDVRADGVLDLVVESQSGGMGYSRSSFQVFNLRVGGWKELIDTESRLIGDSDEYTQQLDVRRTWQSRGQQFCFVKRIFFENGRAHPRPKIENPCYEVGQGVDVRRDPRP